MCKFQQNSTSQNNTWFNVHKIDERTYVINEDGHPEDFHAYLLIGKNSAALIDTGLGIGNIRAITDELTTLPLHIITTHAHWDHIGGHWLYTNQEIYIHAAEVSWLKGESPFPIKDIKELVLSEPITKPLPQNFDITKYALYNMGASKILFDGDTVDLGDRLLRIIHTPGHSPGHICIFEENTGYFFAGDLIYTGSLYAFLPGSDPISYHESISKIAQLENIKLIFPSHNEIALSKEFLMEVQQAFDSLQKSGMLKIGAGIFPFGRFSVKLKKQ